VKKYTSLSLSRYLAELSSDKPVPGGGSVSAYVASLGIGLAEMVGHIGMKRLGTEARQKVRKALRLLAKTRKDSLQVVDLDPRVYQTVMETYGRAKKASDPARKSRMIDEALQNSFRLQADLALLIVMAKEAAQSLDGTIQGSITNDLKVSRALLAAAFHGAYDTARINVVYMKNPEKKKRAEQALEALRKRFELGDTAKS
jgi:glutamate formiminotransferase/formiminotetrahydrofolate cyclodeaminase